MEKDIKNGLPDIKSGNPLVMGKCSKKVVKSYCFLLGSALDTAFKPLFEKCFRFYGKSKLIRRRAFLIGLNLVAVILIWDIYRGTGLYKVITIKKDVYFIWGVILSVTYARILERLGILLYICKLKSKIKNIEVNELAIVFGNLKIKVIAPDGHSKETDYRYLIEKPDEFVVGGIVPIKKDELKKEEIKFLSEKCDIHTTSL